MNKTYKILMGTLLLLQLGSTVVTQNAEAADAFERFYNQSCIPEAQKAGFTEAEAKQGCTCTINALRDKYPTPAFTALFARYLNGQSQARQTLTSYGQTCFEGILEEIIYEN
ncbi:MAG: hypothetical protein QNJ64_21120 [Crocosphaera sp.]|nr:hypothetical protein [Crocosphaera sp.]